VAVMVTEMCGLNVEVPSTINLTIPRMLTRKQLWRRVANGAPRKSTTTTTSADEMSISIAIPSLDRAISEPILNTCPLPSSTLVERAQSSNDLANPKAKKHVQFSGKTKVVLIPCLNDYRSHQLHQELWWEDDDYLQFKHSAKQEISHFLEKGGDLKNMLTQLYQSHQD
jgi:hypothetical protein